ncbi:MAG: YlbF family regulator [Candidatus Enterosoma sp.]|nr:YlbF family regulator [bacterium]MDY5650185.1 YlbF family regulator [Candidatus Enterosoma sp.]MDY5866387.1 YlbF family regulator [Candidatus Enterosoma sp.]
MCNKDDFIKKEDEFISQLLASDIYKEYLESKERMERDKILLSLSEKRKDIYIKMNGDLQKDERKELLSSLEKINKDMFSNPLFIDYENKKEKIKNVLKIIEKGIVEKIR